MNRAKLIAWDPPNNGDFKVHLDELLSDRPYNPFTHTKEILYTT